MSKYFFYGASLLAAWLVTWLVVRFDHVHGRFTADHDLSGTQKFHAKPVPRIGGLGIFLSLGLLSILAYGSAFNSAHNMLLLWTASAPAFIVGLIEDLTKRVSPSVRLIAVMLAAALGVALLGARLDRLDMVGLDSLMQFSAISFAFTLVAVAGVSNAVNIIDGYNGLASGVACLIFAGLGYAAWKVGDYLVLDASIGMICALIGFLYWNFPRGLIFLGDGGAYFVGFMIGELSVLLLVRNPTVSVWYPLVLCSYPVFETLFSIYRKKFVRGQSPGQPDGVHMHMLIYKRLVRMHAHSKNSDAKTERNSITSVYLWGLATISAVPAMIFWDSTIALWILCAVFCGVYLWLYSAIVKFHHPDWLVLAPPEEEE